MEVMELAAELGKLIKKDPRVVEMTRAEEAYEKDTKLQGAIQEYNTQSEALSAEYKKPVQDNEFIKIIENRIHDLYNEIMSNPNMLAYTKAQDAVNEFMNEVNGEITYQITGERPCAHDCSCCEGGSPPTDSSDRGQSNGRSVHRTGLPVRLLSLENESTERLKKHGTVENLVAVLFRYPCRATRLSECIREILNAEVLLI